MLSLGKWNLFPNVLGTEPPHHQHRLGLLKMVQCLQCSTGFILYLMEGSSLGCAKLSPSGACKNSEEEIPRKALCSFQL